MVDAEFPPGTPRELLDIRKALVGFRSTGAVCTVGGSISAISVVLDALGISFGPEVAGVALAASALVVAGVGARVWVLMHRSLRAVDEGIREVFADELVHLPAAPERHPMEAPVLATVDLVDVGQHAIALYGREMAEAVLPPGAPFREHDYRFEIHMATGARCSFGSDATAEYVASWLRREGVLS